jgi:hypothetical protein
LRVAQRQGGQQGHGAHQIADVVAADYQDVGGMSLSTVTWVFLVRQHKLRRFGVLHHGVHAANGPPHFEQVDTSMLNTRFRRCAQVIALCYCPGVLSSFAW